MGNMAHKGRGSPLTRREFVRKSASLGAAATLTGCGLVRQSTRTPFHAPPEADLVIGRSPVSVAGRPTEAITINGSMPGALVRLKEGEDATIRVANGLASADSSIHWHGVILPYRMDGVPGVSYAGIAPGEMFTYRFPVRQSGTYWYHSHSGLQEQIGAFGPLIIDPAQPEPFEYDVEHVVMLSDWTFEDPTRVLARLKKQSSYYNYQRQTIAQDGLATILRSRMTWGKMRMDRTDIADITGSTYTYLMNGRAPETNWTGLFRPDQRVRLRFINAAAATYFDVRIPGLEMTIVQADGQNVQPVVVDEFRIAIAETFDVIVTPSDHSAYTIFAEAMDRSGYARGTLATGPGLASAIPERRPRPLLTMRDMGMGMATMQGAGRKGEAQHRQRTASRPSSVRHGPDHHGAGNASVATVSGSRLSEPGIGLENARHRVLVYTDLQSLRTRRDERTPGREIELHLTGNMERYMWSFDGKKFSEAGGPIEFVHGERLRLTFVNDTMMNHPIHLHGMWMELDNGAGRHWPRKHTVNVKPAERVSVEITVDALGSWAFHCHILYHMEMGMFRVVRVSAPTSSADSDQ